MRRSYYFMAAGLLVILLLNLYSCKKDTNTQLGIVGTWAHEYQYDYHQVQHEAYQFNADSTMTLTRTVLDSASRQLLGYNYQLSGQYRLNGSSLKLYHVNISNYYAVSSKLIYTLLGNLTQIRKDTTINYTIQLNTNGPSFNFVYPPCPPNASCIGLILYKKQ